MSLDGFYPVDTQHRATQPSFPGPQGAFEPDLVWKLFQSQNKPNHLRAICFSSCDLKTYKHQNFRIDVSGVLPAALLLGPIHCLVWTSFSNQCQHKSWVLPSTPNPNSVHYGFCVSKCPSTMVAGITTYWLNSEAIKGKLSYTILCLYPLYPLMCV